MIWLSSWRGMGGRRNNQIGSVLAGACQTEPSKSLTSSIEGLK